MGEREIERERGERERERWEREGEREEKERGRGGMYLCRPDIVRRSIPQSGCCYDKTAITVSDHLRTRY